MTKQEFIDALINAGERGESSLYVRLFAEYIEDRATAAVTEALDRPMTHQAETVPKDIYQSVINDLLDVREYYDALKKKFDTLKESVHQAVDILGEVAYTSSTVPGSIVLNILKVALMEVS